MNRLYFLLILLLTLTSCKRVILEVTGVPENTPQGSRIYVTGNFNHWDPGDENYRLEQVNDSSWQVELPALSGKLKYKFTRGDWTTEEASRCGKVIPNRHIDLASDKGTISHAIESWKDLDPLNCQTITIVLDSIPEDEGKIGDLAVSGTINGWEVDSDAYKFQDAPDGRKILTLQKPDDNAVHEIQIIKSDGVNEIAEANQFGLPLEPRKLEFGKDDTIYWSVQQWEDEEAQNDIIRMVIDRLPSNTPADANLYFASNINRWYPRDSKYKLEKGSDGKYFIEFPGLSLDASKGVEFKITRGNWGNVEVSPFGHDIANRVLLVDEQTREMHISIKEWRDKTSKESKEYVFRITDLPENTPENAKIYLATDHNGWKPNGRKFQMERMPNGTYELKLNTDIAHFQYKFTRGSWANQEVNLDGFAIENRVYEYDGEDYIDHSISAWRDLPSQPGKDIRVVITKLPDNTPEDAELIFAGNCFNWDPGDRSMAFKKNAEGLYEITLDGDVLADCSAEDRNDRKGGLFFKVTRGSWDTVESKKNRKDIIDRYYPVGFGLDYIEIEIEGWRDIKSR
jgi:hypothetical protein